MYLSCMGDVMSRYLKLSLLAVLALISFAPVASAHPHVFVGGYYGPGFYGPAWYSPGWYGPYGYVSGPVTGGVKFETKNKDAAVYVDGGYAGTVGQLKTFQLRPGAHNLQLRDHEGYLFYEEQVTVIAGKTVKLTP
jgi:PEGA domain